MSGVVSGFREFTAEWIQFTVIGYMTYFSLRKIVSFVVNGSALHERPPRLEIGDLTWTILLSLECVPTSWPRCHQANTSLSSKYMHIRSRQQRSPTRRRWSAPSSSGADATDTRQTQLEEHVCPRPETSGSAVSPSRLSSIDGQSKPLSMNLFTNIEDWSLCSRQCLTAGFGFP